jgi:hypothetical protein
MDSVTKAKLIISAGNMWLDPAATFEPSLDEAIVNAAIANAINLTDEDMKDLVPLVRAYAQLRIKTNK